MRLRHKTRQLNQYDDGTKIVKLVINSFFFQEFTPEGSFRSSKRDAVILSHNQLGFFEIL